MNTHCCLSYLNLSLNLWTEDERIGSSSSGLHHQVTGANKAHSSNGRLHMPIMLRCVDLESQEQIDSLAQDSGI